MVEPIFCLMGPTASGKTDLACLMVEKFPFEIISVDSAMIYRDMNIGTAKPDRRTLLKAPHHLIDILDPIDVYSVQAFCQDVKKLSQEIRSHGKIPLLVGGSMMYFHALQQGLASLPEANDSIREVLANQAKEHGWEYMHDLLVNVDPMSAVKIHPNDAQRIQRALEVYQLTGKPLSSLINQPDHVISESFVNVRLMPENRTWLHCRIDKRFKAMLRDGLIDEVQHLLQKWALTDSHPAMRSVGYRQVWSYLKNQLDYDTLFAKGCAATRQLAKRQLTWLRHWPSGVSLNADSCLIERELMVTVKKILDNTSLKQ